MPTLSNDRLTVEIATLGAELRSIRDAEGGEWLWHGDANWWGGRSPLLFPLVGRSPGDAVSIGGQHYPVKQHGFARTATFELERAGDGEAVLSLADGPDTRETFPFAFQLVLTYTLHEDTLTAMAQVENRSDAPMPFQFGFHPGFAWPLPGAEGQSHRVELANGGQPVLHRLHDTTKLLLHPAAPSPFSGGEFEPAAAHFVDDAMLFLDGAGDRFAFAAENGARVDMSVSNLPQFALWQKPGAPYLCLEPWHGTTPFADTGDALETRNGTTWLNPEARAEFAMTMTFQRAG